MYAARFGKDAQRVSPPLIRATISRNCQFGVPLTPLHLVVAPTFERLPADLRKPLARDFYKRRDNAQDWPERYAAQQWLFNEVQQLEREKLHIAFDESEIDLKAKQWAEICQRLGRLVAMQAFAKDRGIEPPEPSDKRQPVSCIARLCCERWWRRQLRKCYTRRAETHLRSIGLVHKRKQLYASDRAVAWRRERKQRDRAMMKEMLAVSDCGDQLELFDVVEKSVSNPALRRAELMTRIRGFEEIAAEHGHVAIFSTNTCPSAFHRTHANGTQNERWEGFAPRDGQAWLNKMWARVRAKLKRLSILFYGFRIAEPHHDGTPHWHLLLFVPQGDADRLRVVLKGVWLSEYAHEAGAEKHRCTVINIDPHKGTAAGYIAKYVAKNIDGFEVGKDFESEDEQEATESADRVAAWASAHGIRQFQQLGGPQVSVWRELRRIREADAEVDSLSNAQRAADAGEWSAFVSAVGGIGRGRSGSVQLWKQTTGECTQYFDLKGPEIVGIESATRRVRTRTKCWRIERKAAVAKESPIRPIDFPVVVPLSLDAVRASALDAWQRSARSLDASACEASWSALLSSLGPVSITVRESESVPTRDAHASARVTSEIHSRGDPPCLH